MNLGISVGTVVPEKGKHHLFLMWLIFMSLLVFTFTVAGQQRLFQLLFEGDRSRICWAIALLFVVVSAYCARRVLFLSRQIDASQAIRDILQNTESPSFEWRDNSIYVNRATALPDCLLTQYLSDLIKRSENAGRDGEELPGHEDLLSVYEGRLKKPNEIGWFMADIMIKLGLLGTIVGFVLMLGSVVNVTDFDASSMQGVLKNMSSGMGTALYTTFAGLVCSILTSSQFYLLDQGADEVVDTARHLAQLHLIPAIGNIR